MSKDRVLGAVLLVCCAILWWGVFPAQIDDGEPAIMAKVVVSMLAIASVLLTLRGGGGPVTSPDWSNWRIGAKWLLFVGVDAAYLLAIPVFGFLSSSFVAAGVFMYFLGERRLRHFALIPAVIVLFLWALIIKMLSYPMPQGLLG